MHKAATRAGIEEQLTHPLHDTPAARSALVRSIVAPAFTLNLYARTVRALSTYSQHGDIRFGIDVAVAQMQRSRADVGVSGLSRRLADSHLTGGSYCWRGYYVQSAPASTARVVAHCICDWQTLILCPSA